MPKTKNFANRSLIQPIALSRTGALLDFNLAFAKLLNTERKTLPGLSILDFLAKSEHRAVLNHLLCCRTSDKPVTNEVQLRHR